MKNSGKKNNSCFHLPPNAQMLSTYDNKTYKITTINDVYKGLCRECNRVFYAFSVCFSGYGAVSYWIPLDHMVKP